MFRKFPQRIFFERFLIHLQKKYFCLEKFKDEPFQSTDSSYCCSNVKSSVIPMACVVSELVWNSRLLGSEPSYLSGWSSTNPKSPRYQPKLFPTHLSLGISLILHVWILSSFQAPSPVLYLSGSFLWPVQFGRMFSRLRNLTRFYLWVHLFFSTLWINFFIVQFSLHYEALSSLRTESLGQSMLIIC